MNRQPLSDEQLAAMMKDVESDSVERKERLTDMEKIRQAVCAFANDMPGHGLPGVLLIGVKDNGGCAGHPVTDEMLLRLADIRSDGNTLPPPSMTVQRRSLDGCEVAVVTVFPSDAPPVRYQGRTWIRVGPRRAVATAEEEKRLSERRRYRDLPWDVRPASSASIQDLDIDFFRTHYLPAAVSAEVLRENNRTAAEQLASLRFVDGPQEPSPTNLGLLVCGKDIRGFLPGAYVQFLRIAGKDLTDPIKNQKEIDGPLSSMLSRLDETLANAIETTSDFTKGTIENRNPNYPLEALQQLARNAVMHRTYDGTNAPVRIYWFDDRIEIHNPGGPYGQVSKANFGRPGITDYRNPHLAEAMKNLGYVQRFGAGIPTARKALERNGNPELEFTVEDSFVAATVRLRQ